MSQMFKRFIEGLKNLTKKEQPFETLTGIVVLFLSIFFLLWAMSKADLHTVNGYTVYASFSKITHLPEGTNVELNGVKIGSVTSIFLDKDYTVKIALSIDDKIKLPKDTIAEIATDGLIGDKYIRLKLGQADLFLNEGESMGSKDFLSLEDMIGQVLFNTDTEEKTE
ncbi:MAG: MCE family protein [Alphaproteobacteria bacterium]|nr:MCE family protein [Alphaproteobacteria bacterium]MBN2779882.1 MCE family protein [Alphaproteobacteria bacterium]